MDTKFEQWAEDNVKILLNKRIATDKVVNSGKESNNPSTRVDHMTDICLGRIIVWKSGDMNIEILDVETRETIMLKYYELQGDENFDTYLEEYFKILVDGNKK